MQEIIPTGAGLLSIELSFTLPGKESRCLWGLLLSCMGPLRAIPEVPEIGYFGEFW
jgi:hypothetical protein